MPQEVTGTACDRYLPILKNHRKLVLENTHRTYPPIVQNISTQIRRLSRFLFILKAV